MGLKVQFLNKIKEQKYVNRNHKYKIPSDPNIKYCEHCHTIETDMWWNFGNDRYCDVCGPYFQIKKYNNQIVELKKGSNQKCENTTSAAVAATPNTALTTGSS